MAGKVEVRSFKEGHLHVEETTYQSAGGEPVVERVFKGGSGIFVKSEKSFAGVTTDRVTASTGDPRTPGVKDGDTVLLIERFDTKGRSRRSQQVIVRQHDKGRKVEVRLLGPQGVQKRATMNGVLGGTYRSLDELAEAQSEAIEGSRELGALMNGTKSNELTDLATALETLRKDAVLTQGFRQPKPGAHKLFGFNMGGA